MPLLLAIVMTMGWLLPASAQRPNPHTRDNATPRATSAASQSATGCGLVEPYVAALYATIDDSGAFADYFYSDADFGDISPTEAKKIIKDGDVMIGKLEALDVPPPYADAHKSIIRFMQISIDTARFYGVDTSVVPDIAAYDGAIMVIGEGERALAKACPDEVDAVGGYILVDPANDVKPVDPENVPK